MHVVSVIALVTALIWAVLLGANVDAAIELAGRQIPGYPNTPQLLVFVGAPIVMLTLTTLSAAAVSYIERNASHYTLDWSRWIAPIPLMCLLCVAPYLVLMAL
jgi:hypothetical protein